ncbi:UNKNOWN [Stylonychia lemnae]|uniref:Uncharacterized protein n=1 Tax=Stylonychia lemnae TaxID=5949 RepID=A0A078A2U7_STYLE|nr:UNKNOWN [Stylonychia lemnae]|eukprot:CDW76157.1 UNKNOWN [Stylonychia lemnae]
MKSHFSSETDKVSINQFQFQNTTFSEDDYNSKESINPSQEIQYYQGGKQYLICQTSKALRSEKINYQSLQPFL